MDDISREAGISKKTLYQQVENKEDLINRSISAFIKEDHDNIEEILAIESYDAFDQMIELFKQSNKLLRSLKPTLIYDLQKYYKESWQMIEKMHLMYIENIIANNINKGIKEGIYRETINAEIVSKLFVTKMLAITNDKKFQNIEHSISRISYQNLLYHLYGVAKHSQHERLENLQEEFKTTII